MKASLFVRLLLTLVGLFAPVLPLPAAEVLLHTKTIIGVEQGVVPPRIVIRLNFFDAKDKQIRDAVLVVTADLAKAISYELSAKGKDVKSKAVEIEKVVLRNNNDQFAGGVDVVPKGELSPDTTYTLQPKDGIWKLKPGYRLPAEEGPIESTRMGSQTWKGRNKQPRIAE